MVKTGLRPRLSLYPLPHGRELRRLHHHCHPLRRPRQAGVKPAVAVLAEGVRLIEEHDLAPLRALRLVDGERVTIGELVRLAPQDGRDILLPALEKGAQHRDLDRPAAAFFFGRNLQTYEVVAGWAHGPHRPSAAVEEALGLVVAQTDEFF